MTEIIETYPAKIYKIVNNIDDVVYIGSTTQLLYKRWNDHKKRSRKPEKNQYSTSTMFKKYGMENCKIVLIKEVTVKNTEELRMKEREVYDEYKSKGLCINQYLPYKSVEEKKKYYQEYGLSHKEEKHEWYEKKKEQISLKRKTERFICECGSSFRLSDKSLHNKTLKHQNFVSSNLNKSK